LDAPGIANLQRCYHFKDQLGSTLQMAEAEIHAQKTIQSRSRQEIEKLIADYRRITSEFLATLCREADSKLPPLEK